MMNELKGTAFHEAAHAVALHHFRVSVIKVEVTTNDSGETVAGPELSGLTPENKGTVFLAGIYAESSVRTERTAKEFHDMAAGASSDRCLLFEEFPQWWASLTGTGVQVAHNKAEKFVQDHKAHIAKVAGALLSKKGLPKVLNYEEFLSALLPGPSLAD